jgi:redox-sensitive bicupin YhaK (pirin superfamily)
LAEATMNPGKTLVFPQKPDWECALYPVDGSIQIGEGESALDVPMGNMVLVKPNLPVAVTSTHAKPLRVMVLGGPKLEKPRHISWNFVSSQRDRLEEMRRLWKDQVREPRGRFPLITKDAKDFVPLS